MDQRLITPHELVLLFDECGTPAFTRRPDMRHFIGVSALYARANEEHLFEASAQLGGLRRRSPKKNYTISPDTVEKLANVIGSLPVAITVRYIDVTDTALQASVQAYKRIGDIARLNVRAREEPGVRERKIPQILHSHMLCYCLLEPLMALIDDDFPLFAIEPFIDAWSIPASDRPVYLAKRGRSLQESVNRLLHEINMPGYVSVSHIRTLDPDEGPPIQTRKRFIDVITSVVSRSPRFQKRGASRDPIVTLERCGPGKVTCRDVTTEVTTFCTEFRTKVVSELRRRGETR